MSLVRETADSTWAFRTSVSAMDVTDVPQANYPMGMLALTRYPVIKGLDISER